MKATSQDILSILVFCDNDPGRMETIDIIDCDGSLVRAIPVGVETEVARDHVELLRKVIVVKYTITDGQVVSRERLRYPFAVLHDPAAVQQT